jgi:two-component system response regulator FixJ
LLGQWPSRAKQDNPMNGGQEPELAHPMVIVVDDDAAVRGSLKFAFEIEGFSVRAYAQGNEVLDDSTLADCSCFIIDQKLPGMSGLELVAALRKQRIVAPAILITSQLTIILQECAARAGVPIVEKPLLDNALLERVRDVIAHPSPTH